MADRFAVNTLTGVTSVDYAFNFLPRAAQGFNIHINGNGNFELNLLANNFGTTVAGDFVDITSLVAGGATITTNGFRRVAGFYPGAVRVNVTSVQAAKVVNVALGV